MTTVDRRYVVVSPDRATAAGFDTPEGAETAALAFGDGAHVVDTGGTPYHPAVMKVEGGALGYQGYGAVDGRASLDSNLIEGAKKGHAAVVRAFLARGGRADAADDSGGTALHWAVAGGGEAVVRMLIAAGAPVDAADGGGTTPLMVAEKKGKGAIADLLRQAGA